MGIKYFILSCAEYNIYIPCIFLTIFYFLLRIIMQLVEVGWGGIAESLAAAFAKGEIWLVRSVDLLPVCGFSNINRA